MIAIRSREPILNLQILADGSCRIGPSHRTANDASYRQLGQNLSDTAARGIVKSILAERENPNNKKSLDLLRDIRLSYGTPQMQAFLQSLEESIDSFYCDDLLDTALVVKYLRRAGSRAPRTKALAVFLREAGFIYLGQFTVDRVKRSLWSRNPGKFLDDYGQVDSERIRDHVEDL